MPSRPENGVTSRTRRTYAKQTTIRRVNPIESGRPCLLAYRGVALAHHVDRTGSSTDSAVERSVLVRQRAQVQTVPQGL
jgi:hypothetical protein